MKITKTKILYILVSFVLISSVRFFYIIPLPFGTATSSVMLCSLCSLFAFLVLCMLYHNLNKGKYFREIIFLTFLVIADGFYMKIAYNFTFQFIFQSISPFFILLNYFLFLKFINENGIDNFIKLIETITFFLAIILLLQKLVYEISYIWFIKVDMPFAYTGRVSNISDGLIRISVILSAYKLISKNISKLSVLNFILSGICVLFIDQSRIYALSVLTAIIVMIILKNSKEISIFKVIISILIIMFIIYGAFYFINSLSNALNDSDNISSSIRRNALNYYFSIMHDHFWTGLGIASNLSVNNPYFTFIRGPLGLYSYSDLGIFGIYASLGILGALCYIWIILKGIILSKKSIIWVLNYGLLTEILISAFTMSYLDKPRLISLVLVLVFISCEYDKYFGDIINE